MKLKDARLSKISQASRDKYHIISFLCRICKSEIFSRYWGVGGRKKVYKYEVTGV
jgi:hypothetical protein